MKDTGKKIYSERYNLNKRAMYERNVNIERINNEQLTEFRTEIKVK